MICLPQRRTCPPSRELPRIFDPDHEASPRIYDGRFWLASASNLCTAIAVALLFRYADLVHRLGGGEFELGWIVGIGMVGSLTIRLALGRAIASHGPRTTWLVSLAVLAATCFAHLLLQTCHGPAIYVLRLLFASSVAGVYGSSITWVGSRVPRARLAEVVGTLGASGFVAWAVGNTLGDVLSSGPGHVERLFVVAGLCTLVAMVFSWLATAGIVPAGHSSNGSTARVLWRYSPRIVLLVGAAAGLVLGLPSTFLRTYTADLGITTMSWFFGVYAGVALAVRVAARKLPERFGLAPVILLGLSLLCAGLLAFLVVNSAWQLAIPAVIFGFAHALIFPPIVAASTLSFPESCRGLGTLLILAAYDVGVLVGTPLSGAIVRYSPSFGLPPYPTMFIAVAALTGAISLVFGGSLLWRGRRIAAQEPQAAQATPSEEKATVPLASFAPLALRSGRQGEGVHDGERNRSAHRRTCD